MQKLPLKKFKHLRHYFISPSYPRPKEITLLPQHEYRPRKYGKTLKADKVLVEPFQSANPARIFAFDSIDAIPPRQKQWLKDIIDALETPGKHLASWNLLVNVESHTLLDHIDPLLLNKLVNVAIVG